MQAQASMAFPNSSESRSLRVLLVDDHRSLLWGLGKLMESSTRPTQVVGTAVNGAEALALAREHRPDVILLDLDLDGENGLHLIRQLRDACGARVLILTGLRDPGLREQVVLEGASGLVHKSESSDVILKALEHVCRGEIWLDRASIANAFATISGRPADRGHRAPEKPADSLSVKEREVIVVVVENRSAPIKVIADRLHLSPHTVRNHLASIYDKLGVHSRLELYVLAKELGLDRAQGW